MSLAVHEWQWPIANAAMAVATLQVAGLAGRLFWGWISQATPHTLRLLGLLGALMATAGALLMTWQTAPLPIVALLLTTLGFTASGWNNVLVAEVARQSEGRETGALTGAVIMFGYAGLALAPLGFAAFTAAASMAGAFSGRFVAAGLVGLALLGSRRGQARA